MYTKQHVIIFLLSLVLHPSNSDWRDDYFIVIKDQIDATKPGTDQFENWISLETNSNEIFTQFV